jgi:hypothetical protein
LSSKDLRLTFELAASLSNSLRSRSVTYETATTQRTSEMRGNLCTAASDHRRMNFTETMDTLDNVRKSAVMSSEFFVEAVAYRAAIFARDVD